MSNLRIAAEQALKSLGDAITVWTEEMEFRSSIDAADKWLESYAALREALAQPEQEPIAYFDPQEKGFYWALPTKINAPVSVKVDPLALYAAPPKSEL